MKKVILIFSLLVLGACAERKFPPPAAIDPQVEKACATRFAKSDACVNLEWETLPGDKTFGSFTFSAPAEPAVVLWMPSMGHGSRPVVVEALGEGRYRATKVFFIMRGEWDIHIQVKSTNDEAIIPFVL